MEYCLARKRENGGIKKWLLKEWKLGKISGKMEPSDTIYGIVVDADSKDFYKDFKEGDVPDANYFNGYFKGCSVLVNENYKGTDTTVTCPLVTCAGKTWRFRKNQQLKLDIKREAKQEEAPQAKAPAEAEPPAPAKAQAPAPAPAEAPAPQAPAEVPKEVRKGLEEVATSYQKLREKYLKSLADMKEAIPKGFVTGSRIQEGDRDVPGFDLTIAKKGIPYEAIRSLLDFIDSFIGAKMSNIEQYFSGGESELFKEERDNIRLSLQEINANKDTNYESYKKVIGDIKTLLSNADKYYTQTIIDKFHEEVDTIETLLVGVEKIRSDIGIILGHVNGTEVKVPSKDDMFKGALKPENKFSFENAVANLFNCFNAVYEEQVKNKPEDFKDVEKALIYYDPQNVAGSFGLMSADELSKKRLDAGAKLINYIQGHKIDLGEGMVKFELTQVVEFVIKELQGTSKLLGDINNDTLKVIKTELEKDIKKYSDMYKATKNVEDVKTFIESFFKWIYDTLKLLHETMGKSDIIIGYETMNSLGEVCDELNNDLGEIKGKGLKDAFKHLVDNVDVTVIHDLNKELEKNKNDSGQKAKAEAPKQYPKQEEQKAIEDAVEEAAKVARKYFQNDNSIPDEKLLQIKAEAVAAAKEYFSGSIYGPDERLMQKVEAEAEAEAKVKELEKAYFEMKQPITEPAEAKAQAVAAAKTEVAKKYFQDPEFKPNEELLQKIKAEAIAVAKEYLSKIGYKDDKKLMQEVEAEAEAKVKELKEAHSIMKQPTTEPAEAKAQAVEEAPKAKKNKLEGKIKVLKKEDITDGKSIPEIIEEERAKRVEKLKNNMTVLDTKVTDPNPEAGKKVIGVPVLPGAVQQSKLTWPDWNKFKKQIGKSKLKDFDDFVKRFKLLGSKIEKYSSSLPIAGGYKKPEGEIKDIRLLEDEICAAGMCLASVKYYDTETKKVDEGKVNELKNNFYDKRAKICKIMNGISTMAKEGIKEQWNYIKELIRSQLDELERILVRKTPEESKEKVAKKEEALGKQGPLRRAGGRLVKSVAEGWSSLTGKSVDLTLDSTTADKFKTLKNGIDVLCEEQKQKPYKDLKALFVGTFSDRKNTYRSWYKYVEGITHDIDKYIKDYNRKDGDSVDASIKPAVQISLMYVLVRSMLHCDLKQVNTIREGIKRFVSEIDGNISSKTNIEDLDKQKFDEESKIPVEVKKAGTKTKQLCKNVKSDMLEVLSRKKSLREKVLRKEDCKKILDFLPAKRKDLRKKIVK